MVKINPNRTWGVEIECCLEDSFETARNALKNAGVECSEDSSYHRSYDNINKWEVKGDGSLGSNGIEVVSPPSKGVSGLKTLSSVMLALRDQGAYVDKHCGFHVHHSAKGLIPARYWHMLSYYWALEPFLWCMVNKDRRKQSYCRETYFGDLERNVMNKAEASRYLTGGDRYQSLNLSAIPTFGTVEFRLFQGTVENVEAIHWIRLTQRIMEVLKTEKTLIDQPFVVENVEGFFEILNLTGELSKPWEKTKEYIQSRVKYCSRERLPSYLRAKKEVLDDFQGRMSVLEANMKSLTNKRELIEKLSSIYRSNAMAAWNRSRRERRQGEADRLVERITVDTVNPSVNIPSLFSIGSVPGALAQLAEEPIPQRETRADVPIRPLTAATTQAVDRLLQWSEECTEIERQRTERIVEVDPALTPDDVQRARSVWRPAFETYEEFRASCATPTEETT